MPVTTALGRMNSMIQVYLDYMTTCLRKKKSKPSFVQFWRSKCQKIAFKMALKWKGKEYLQSSCNATQNLSLSVRKLKRDGFMIWTAEMLGRAQIGT